MELPLLVKAADYAGDVAGAHASAGVRTRPYANRPRLEAVAVEALEAVDFGLRN
jgi:hypothetical protein